MLAARFSMETTDVRRAVLDFGAAEVPWLDPAETLTAVTVPVITLQPFQGDVWSDGLPMPVGLPADPTPLQLQSAAILPGNTQVQLFLTSGTPGNVYQISLIVTGTSGRQQTIEMMVQVRVVGTPATTPAPVPPGAVAAFASPWGTPGDLIAFSAVPGKLKDAGTSVSVVQQVAATSGLPNATLTGTPTAPTAPLGTNTTQLATTAFVIANAGQEWTAGTVSALSDMLTVASGTLELAGAATHEKYVLSISGTLSPSTQYWTVPVVDPVTVPAGWSAPSSAGACSTTAAGTATALTVSYVRAGATTELGTVTFNVAANTAVLVGPVTAVSLLAGDLLIAATGASVDSRLANVGFTMTATKD